VAAAPPRCLASGVACLYCDAGHAVSRVVGLEAVGAHRRARRRHPCVVCQRVEDAVLSGRPASASLPLAGKLTNLEGKLARNAGLWRQGVPQLRACAALIAANCSSCSASVKRAGASLASSAATPHESSFADTLLARRHRLRRNALLRCVNSS